MNNFGKVQAKTTAFQKKNKIQVKWFMLVASTHVFTCEDYSNVI